MAKAGDNEEKFKNLCEEFGINLLGKMAFEDEDDKNYISVDNSIIFEDKIILIEIDSSNEAKLVAGQYALLNILKDKPTENTIKNIGKNDKKEFIFFVIHFYKSYKPDRLKKNLKLIRNTLLKNKGIRYGCIHLLPRWQKSGG